MVGDTQLIVASKTGKVAASVQVSEGGNMGVVEYYAETSLFQGGALRSKAQINADLAADIAQQRSNQGATATPDPALESYDFAGEAGL